MTRAKLVLAVLCLVFFCNLLPGCVGRDYGYRGAWESYTNRDAKISFSYPASWALTTEQAPADTYGTLYIASLNSFGMSPLWLQRTEPRPNNWFYISEQNLRPIPPSGAYIEIGRLDPEKVILGGFPLVRGKGLKGAKIIHEGPITAGNREYDKYLVEFITDDIHCFYVFSYLTENARTAAKPVFDRFIKNVTVLD